MAEVNVVLRGEVSFEAMSEYAQAQGWKLDKKSVDASEGEESPEYIWRVRKGTKVTLVQSRPLHRDYLVLEAPQPEEISKALRLQFPSYETSEVPAKLATAHSEEEKIDALHTVAATGLREYHDTVYKAVEQSMHDSDSLVRLAAVTAAFYLRWKQFKPLLMRISETDDSDNLRATSANLLGSTHWDLG